MPKNYECAPWGSPLAPFLLSRWAMALCALLATVTPMAVDADDHILSAKIAKVPGLVNGDADIATWPCKESSEFPPHWGDELTFVESPEMICVRWGEHDSVKAAKWVLERAQSGGTAAAIASGDVPAALLAGTAGTFQIPVRPPLALYNSSGATQDYHVRILSKLASSGSDKPSTTTTLRHQPKAVADPYACTTGPSRKVVLTVPKMAVNQVSSTDGDGVSPVPPYRDELYFRVARKGPGTGLDVDRLPGNDDYYQAFQGGSVNADSFNFKKDAWSNKDNLTQKVPTLWSGTLKHGEEALLTVTAMEQDNSDLQNIGEALETAWKAIATVAAPLGAIGGIVSGVATAAAAGSGLIPDTHGHDTVGMAAILLRNQCGYLEATSVTYSKVKTSAGTVRGAFNVPNQLGESIQSRLAVIEKADSQIHTRDFDWGPFVHKFTQDEFFWDAKGTSGSSYTFLLRTKVD